MMQVMKDIGGVEMPEFLARLSPDAKVAERPVAAANGAPAAAEAATAPKG